MSDQWERINSFEQFCKSYEVGTKIRAQEVGLYLNGDGQLAEMPSAASYPVVGYALANRMVEVQMLDERVFRPFTDLVLFQKKPIQKQPETSEIDAIVSDRLEERGFSWLAKVIRGEIQPPQWMVPFLQNGAGRLPLELRQQYFVGGNINCNATLTGVRRSQRTNPFNRDQLIVGLTADFLPVDNPAWDFGSSRIEFAGNDSEQFQGSPHSPPPVID